jgi:CheY-like chemotaxis protein
VAVARVLLVEPNDHLRRVFRRRFVREGFELVEAVDAEAALGEARSGLPDVIVVEGSVRDAGGLDLPLRLASDPDLRWVPLIVLEGRGHWNVAPGQRAEDEAATEVVTEVVAKGVTEGAAIAAVPLDVFPLTSDAAFDALSPRPQELRHPFRPGRLVELARGAIASGVGAASDP